MPKTLRVGFAMGGGVSLGTFSGAALSEALKLLILYGRDREGNPYGDIVVDVFSGASAGALSLAAMLRCLTFRTDNEEKRAEEKLRRELGKSFEDLTPKVRENLIAAQAVQENQEELWTREIKLSKLLADGNDNELRFKGSLLDRGAVDAIARRYLVDWLKTGTFKKRKLLADRVLYACTLANLTPMLTDARAEFPGRDIGYVGLNDGMRSSTHRDLRVFDLNFTSQADAQDDRFPDRWCLYHDGPDKAKLIGDLKAPGTWAKIASTAIASGAFPLAFEPVVIPRKAFEYGKKLWCPSFDKLESAYDSQDSHVFSFVDGGTFNNEPIREAFRLASFVDGYTRVDDPDAEFERLIIFVDPAVSSPLPTFKVPILRRWMVEDPNIFGSLDGFDLRRAASLDRLLPHVGTLIGALTDEGRVNEADGVFQVRRLFELRSKIRAALDATLGDTASDSVFNELKKFCSVRLDANNSDEAIPPGPLTLNAELERLIYEEIQRRIKEGNGSDFTALRGKAATFVAAAEPSQETNSKLWLRLLNFLAVDLILGLEGKLEHAQLIAIAPFMNLREKQVAGRTVVEFDTIDLPSGRLSGFAGFTSDVSDQLDLRAARHCAAEFLRKCGCVAMETPLPKMGDLKLSPAELRTFEGDVSRGLKDLADRAGTMVQQSHLVKIFPLLDSAVKALVGHFIKSSVADVDWKGAREFSAEFRVTVPNQNFELDGAQDCEPVEETPNAPWTLFTIAQYNFDTQQWSGGFVKEGKLDIDEDGAAFLRDRDFCEIELPTEEQLREAAFSPNATFSIDLKKTDRNKTLPSNRWALQPGAIPLEDQLLAE